jgi:hypothetical protein
MPAHHPEPIAIEHKQVRLACRSLEIADRISVHRAEVPLANPIPDPACRKTRSIGNHLAEVLRYPAVNIVSEQVGFAVAINVCGKEAIVACHASPTRNVAIVPVHHNQLPT